MARRYSASQIRSKIRQAQQKQRQVINKYNQGVRRHNQGVRSAVNKYNQGVRAHNARVRAYRQRLRNEFARLRSQSRSTRATSYVAYQTSVRSLHESYMRFEDYGDSGRLSPHYNRILDLSERETANCLAVTNSIFGEEDAAATPVGEIENAKLLDGLRTISADLDDRWRGAVFALDPGNPDAARHFCTSAREIITQILELKAPDADVMAMLPTCEKTVRGNPTRRSRIRYFLHRKGMDEASLEEFVERDMENVVELFRVFNDGTHGSAGTFDLSELDAIKVRVEDAIMFLTEIIDEA